MAVSAASLLSSSALANTETISVPQIVNETTLQEVRNRLESYNEFFLTELGAIWVDGATFEKLMNGELTESEFMGEPDKTPEIQDTPEIVDDISVDDN